MLLSAGISLAYVLYVEVTGPVSEEVRHGKVKGLKGTKRSLTIPLLT